MKKIFAYNYNKIVKKREDRNMLTIFYGSGEYNFVSFVECIRKATSGK